MAKKGTAFFDNKGHFFRTPEEASLSDLAALLGKIGDGESLAPGIAHILLERRADIEAIFAEHDEMKREEADSAHVVREAANVTELPSARTPKAG